MDTARSMERQTSPRSEVSMTGNPSGVFDDEPTIELVVRAQKGDTEATKALLQRSLPSLKRATSGRMPWAVRGSMDAGDLVQGAALQVLKRIHTFRPQHSGAMPQYLRDCVSSRICDEVRRIGRRPVSVELTEDHSSDCPSPEELAIRSEACERIRLGLGHLTPKNRELIVARVHREMSLARIAREFGLPSSAAAGMAVSRAIRQLKSDCAGRARPARRSEPIARPSRPETSARRARPAGTIESRSRHGSEDREDR
jgi:RNA polymerase sigma factor (sigma-70 family)